MISEKQLEANRANAQQSTGPKTAEGKQRSSINARRHGLTGQVDVMPEEELEAYNNFTKEMVESLQPVNANERQLAHLYATLHWRINRGASIENNMFTLGLMEEVAENLNIEHAQIHNATSNAKTFRNESREFDRISLYTHRLINQADKIFKQLKQLQDERRQREFSQLAEVAKIYKIHQLHNSTFDPRKNGFDFSIDDVKAFIRRRNLSDPAIVAEQIQENLSRAL